MNIAILGAGNVGATLGKRFAEQGHTISFGVPNPQKYADSGLPGTVSAVVEAAQAAEIILLAVPYNAVEQVIKDCGDLRGKVLIDATNPLGMTEKGLALTTGFSTSGAEKIAALVPAARLVKCFNQTGFGNMAEPRQSVMFVCGDDASANETVRQLAAEIGFDAIAIGALDKARLLEPLAMLWIHLSFTTNLGREFAFRLQRG
jgi:predicted dinucleotide-binding enzyme